MFTAGDKNFVNKNSGCDVLTFKPDERTDLLKKLDKIDFGDIDIASNYENIDWFAFDCLGLLFF